MSDYDFAVYLDEPDRKAAWNTRLDLLARLQQRLGTDDVDVVTLNTTKSPELKYNVIASGKLLYEQEPFKVLVEPRILHEYFDFRFMLRKYGLTKA